MQDIGGLRVIFDDMESVRKLVEMYRTTKSRHELFCQNDYIEKHKSDGYRSVHLIYKKYSPRNLQDSSTFPLCNGLKISLNPSINDSGGSGSMISLIRVGEGTLSIL